MKAQSSSGCPACGSTAYYRYGNAANGKKRHICLICNRQYVVDGSRTDDRNRPDCPACSQPMHRYMQTKGFTRYRCKNHPHCRTYLKVSTPSASEPPPAKDDVNRSSPSQS